MKFRILSLVCLMFFTVGKSFAQKADSNKGVHIEEFVEIGGIKQWLYVKGNDSSKPVLLLTHGGPGSTFSPFIDALYKGWEENFILATWDQRGAGETYGANNPPEELTEEFLKDNPLVFSQLINDGVEVTEYLKKVLNKDKVILFGSSWGSVLAANMALKRPDLYYAYIGHSQMVNPTESHKAAFEKVSALVEESNDSEAKALLDRLGPPNYEQAREFGQLLRVVKKYEVLNSIPAPESFYKWSSRYDTAEIRGHRYAGDDYSFLYFAGHKKLGIKPIYEEINLGTHFDIPVYFLQGKHDILTPYSINKGYFEKIEAPQKELFLLSTAGHDFNEEVMQKKKEILNKFIIPLIK